MILPYIAKLRYFTQRVLPIVYDDSLSYQELSYKVVCKINELISTNDTLVDNFNQLNDNFESLKQWCDNYFKNLDITDEINSRVDYLIRSGIFDSLVNDLVEDIASSKVTAWLNQHITQPTTPAIDTSLTVGGAAADAGATGSRLRSTESITGLEWYNGYYQTSNNQFVGGTTAWKTSSAIPCQAGDSITYCGASSQTGRHVITFFNQTGRYLSNMNNIGTDLTEVTVTVPEGAEFFRVLMRTADFDKTYIIYGANAVQNVLYENRMRIIALEDFNVHLKECFVDPETGSDTNAGTVSAPLQSIKGAVDLGFRRIHARPGIYDAAITLSNDNISVDMWSADSFDTSKPDKEKIIMFRGDVVTAAGSNELTATYTPREGSRFVRVFVTGDLPPIDESFQYAEAYNVCAFLWEPGHKSRRYKPVLPTSYTSEPGTFTFTNGTIRLTPWPTDEGLKKIYISADPARGFALTSTNAVFKDITFLGMWFTGISAVGGNVESVNCDFICISHGNGIAVRDGNATIDNNFASGCAQDGYGFSAYGESVMTNCKAYYSGDDGVSHHHGTKGYIIGGEFSYNTSGGITPAFGADVNINGAVCEYNLNGLQFLGAAEYVKRNLTVINCLSLRNTNKDIFNSGYDIRFLNCIYDTQEATPGNNNVFYNSIG